MNIDEVKKSLKIKSTHPKDKSMDDLAMDIGTMVTELRIVRGMTQGMLASKIGTKQPSIARLENGTYLPSLKTLYKIAKATNTYLITPKFDLLEGSKSVANTTLSMAYISVKRKNVGFLDKLVSFETSNQSTANVFGKASFNLLGIKI